MYLCMYSMYVFQLVSRQTSSVCMYVCISLLPSVYILYVCISIDFKLMYVCMYVCMYGKYYLNRTPTTSSAQDH